MQLRVGQALLGINQAVKRFALTRLHPLAGLRHVEPGHAGRQHFRRSGVEVDRGAHRQQRDKRLKRLQGVGRHPQPGQLRHAVRQQAGFGAGLAGEACRTGLQQALHQGIELGLGQMKVLEQTHKGVTAGHVHLVGIDQVGHIQAGLQVLHDT